MPFSTLYLPLAKLPNCVEQYKIWVQMLGSTLLSKETKIAQHLINISLQCLHGETLDLLFGLSFSIHCVEGKKLCLVVCKALPLEPKCGDASGCVH